MSKKIGFPADQSEKPIREPSDIDVHSSTAAPVRICPSLAVSWYIGFMGMTGV